MSTCNSVYQSMSNLSEHQLVFCNLQRSQRSQNQIRIYDDLFVTYLSKYLQFYLVSNLQTPSRPKGQFGVWRFDWSFVTFKEVKEVKIR